MAQWPQPMLAHWREPADTSAVQRLARRPLFCRLLKRWAELAQAPAELETRPSELAPEVRLPQVPAMAAQGEVALTHLVGSPHAPRP